MKLISTKDEYESIHSYVCEIIDASSKIPYYVFNVEFPYFLFLTFDDILNSDFFNNIVRYIKKTERNEFWVTSVDPSPISYYGVNFNFWGAMCFNLNDTAKEYIKCMYKYPENSIADALAHNGKTILYSSEDLGWSIYADRDSDIAICSFLSKRDMDDFQLIFGSCLLSGVESAANYAYYNKNSNSEIDIFCRTYRTR